MDAVAQNGLFAQNTVILQPLHGAAAIVLERVVHIVHALGHMDVVAGAAVIGLHHAVEGLVADGEQRVAAEHGRQHGVVLLLTVGDEVGVLLDGLQALLLTVAVADLVAQAGAQPQSAALLADGKQGAGDLAVAGVVVEDRGDALLDAVDVQRRGGGAGTVHHQVAVDSPPCAVQHLIEVGGVVARDAQAPGQRGVDVGVGVDKCGHDDAALSVDDVGVGVLGPQRGLLAHLYDLRALKGHRTVLIIALPAGVTGDEPSVGQKFHLCSSSFVFGSFFLPPQRGLPSAE